MTGSLTFGDIAVYLAHAGWRERAERWRGAAIWSDADGRDVFVPATDELGDREPRIDEILDLLADVEGRPREDIAWDIGSPFTEIQSYVTFAPGITAGETTLTGGPDVAGCVRNLVTTVMADAPDDLLHRIRLRPTHTDGYGVTIGIPADHPMGAQLGERLRQSITAVAAAAGLSSHGGDEDPSADVCAAVSRLSGPDGQWPFQITFRPAIFPPSERATEILSFPAGTGDKIRAIADQPHHHEDEQRMHISGMLPLLEPYPPLEDTDG